MRRVAVGLLFVFTLVEPVWAQDAGATRRVAVDTVVGWQDYATEYTDWPAQVVFDMFSSARVGAGWQVSFRPKLWRVRGEWDGLLDQLSVQREFRKGSNWRVEAGRFPTPIGLGMTENRADVNAGMVWWHRAYYMPLPSLGAGVPKVSLASAVYPEGALVSTSSHRWDARGAVLDRAPVQFWRELPGAVRGPNGMLGGGLTPRPGLRLGLAAAWGPYAAATSSNPSRHYVMLNAEGEYAVAYTKISGEWNRDRFDTALGERVSDGWTLQAQQTITPRLFAHTRVSLIRSPEALRTTPLTTTMREYRSIDTTVGYRLNPQITLRAGHSAIRSWTSAEYEQQIGVSLMWATRWW